MNVCSLCGEKNTVSVVTYDRKILGLQVNGWTRYECSHCGGEWVDGELFNKSTALLDAEVAKEWTTAVESTEVDSDTDVKVTLTGMTIRHIFHRLRDRRDLLQMALDAINGPRMTSEVRANWIEYIRRELEKKV